MSRILTHSEYESLSVKLSYSTAEEPETTTTLHPAPLPSQKELKIRMEYMFIHPDKLHDQSDGKFIVMGKNGHMVEIPIEGGCLKTNDPEIKNALISKGMIFTYEREIQE